MVLMKINQVNDTRKPARRNMIRCRGNPSVSDYKDQSDGGASGFQSGGGGAYHGASSLL